MNDVPIPQGKYKPAVRFKDLIFTSGMTPRLNGKLAYCGKVKADADPQIYKEAVYLAAGNAFAAASGLLNGDEKIAAIVSITVYINAEEGFALRAKIGDLASDYFVQILKERGIGVRAAIGAATLPGGAPVEIQIIAAAEKI